jgi:hypothetical protein
MPLLLTSSLHNARNIAMVRNALIEFFEFSWESAEVFGRKIHYLLILLLPENLA